MKCKWAVTINYSFDIFSAKTVIFDDLNEAMKFLVDSATEEYRIDRQENQWNAELKIDDSKRFAQIVDHFDLADDIKTYILSDVE